MGCCSDFFKHSGKCARATPLLSQETSRAKGVAHVYCGSPLSWSFAPTQSRRFRCYRRSPRTLSGPRGPSSRGTGSSRLQLGTICDGTKCPNAQEVALWQGTICRWCEKQQVDKQTRSHEKRRVGTSKYPSQTFCCPEAVMMTFSSCVVGSKECFTIQYPHTRISGK